MEASCLELQDSHGLDVDVVLWCLHVATRGIRLDVVMPADFPYTEDNCQELGFIDYSKQAAQAN